MNPALPQTQIIKRTQFGVKICSSKNKLNIDQEGRITEEMPNKINKSSRTGRRWNQKWTDKSPWRDSSRVLVPQLRRLSRKLPPT